MTRLARMSCGIAVLGFSFCHIISCNKVPSSSYQCDGEACLSPCGDQAGANLTPCAQGEPLPIPVKREDPLTQDQNILPNPNTSPAPSAPNIDGAAVADDRAAQVASIMAGKCLSCHGVASKAAAGMSDITNLEKMVSDGYVIAGESARSILYTRSIDQASPMPPAPAELLSDEELLVIKAWIDVDLVNGAASNGPRTDPTSLSTEFRAMLADLQKVAELSPSDAANNRYISLVAQFNAGADAERMKFYATTVSRFVNSISKSDTIRRPVPVDDSFKFLRIDIRDYGWTAEDWDAIMINSRLSGLNPDQELRDLAVALTDPDGAGPLTGTADFVARADWFIYTASQAQIYHRLTNIPATVAELEAQIGFSMATNQATQMASTDPDEHTVIRSGFMRSGVSHTNRMMERHQTGQGSFWLSYDFLPPKADDNLDEIRRKNLFASPLGPSLDQSEVNDLNFNHDGGEIIFSLPNGMLGYMLALSDGGRIDVAPNEVVFDPKRPEGIMNGYSCLTCHSQGYLPKRDEVRDAANSMEITAAQKKAILQLYPEQSAIDTIMQEDNATYRAVLATASYEGSESAPGIMGLGIAYAGEVTLVKAACELGVSASRLRQAIKSKASSALKGQLSPLLKEGGVIKRTLIEPLLPSLAELVY